MKRLLSVIAVLALGFVAGFAVGRATNNQPEVRVVAVDCYDSMGNRVEGFAEKYGGVTTSCAPGQIAKARATQ